MNVTIYTIPDKDSTYCKDLKDYLNGKSIQFVEKDVQADKTALAEMLQKSGNFAGVPVTIMEENGKTVTLKGFTPKEFDDALVSFKSGTPTAMESAEKAAAPAAPDMSMPAPAAPMGDMPAAPSPTEKPAMPGLGSDMSPSSMGGPAAPAAPMSDATTPTMPDMSMPAAPMGDATMPETPAAPTMTPDMPSPMGDSMSPAAPSAPMGDSMTPAAPSAPTETLKDPQDELSSLLNDLQTKTDGAPAAPTMTPDMPAAPSMPSTDMGTGTPAPTGDMSMPAADSGMQTQAGQ